MSPHLRTTLRWLMLPIRCMALVLCVVIGLCIQLLMFAWLKHSHKHVLIRLFAQSVLFSLGVTRSIEHPTGTQDHPMLAPNASLVVSNHISWLDIVVILSALPVVFVAKSEIRRWPVLGYMVALAGTCFIQRDRRHALRYVYRDITLHLNRQQSVCVFPEGTTSDGHSVLHFHAGLFESAIAAAVPVTPIDLQYSSPLAAYVGNMTLLRSVANILLCPNPIQARMVVLRPIFATDTDRQTLCAAARSAIVQAHHAGS